MESLKLFVNHTTQVIGLWKILTQHQFHILMESLPPNHQQLLQNTTFKDVFLFGHEICCNLINSLINSYLGDNASVDSISAKLRDTCPSLYKAEDAACSKVSNDKEVEDFGYNDCIRYVTLLTYNVLFFILMFDKGQRNAQIGETRDEYRRTRRIATSGARFV